MSSDHQPYPLYNTTYTLHRLSPLYIPTGPFTNASLRPYAKSFRDILAGDTLRGVRVGLGADEDILARVGALQTVTWKILPEEEFWEVEDVDLDTTIVGDERRGRGVLVEVVYERSRYTAVLMREEKDKSEGDTGHGDGEKGGFQRFPLLLTRMPGSLRETFLQFLERNFDARISSLCLGKEHMIGALESYIIDCGRDEDGELQLSNMGQVSKSVLRDVQVVIGFEAGVSLKTIEVLIMTEDVTKMVMSGRRLERKDGTRQESPFMAAMGNYIDAHLALNIKHDRVKIVRIACGAFVIGADGKAKLTEPISQDGDNVQHRATSNLISGLLSNNQSNIERRAP